MSEATDKPKLTARKIFAVAIMLLAAIGILLWCTLHGSMTEISVHRIAVGMPQAQVGSILGPQNPLPHLRRTNEAFWDANTLFGFRYLSIRVKYDASGKVESTTVNAFWRWPPSWWTI
jgi:hypothetical protein